jgi:hypothetical protein
MRRSVWAVLAGLLLLANGCIMSKKLRGTIYVSNTAAKQYCPFRQCQLRIPDEGDQHSWLKAISIPGGKPIRDRRSQET